ncbi:hypothetical protein CDAR_200251 [Caerostris darwini]|uniref:Uncharacterized protein n=1 Tax=Caerostris darwini TaxID=1538125 RepID=A0AAV4RP79_9ARAC|nr:hypothetical protein CDAR_200251 [Caerostris darwini]
MLFERDVPESFLLQSLSGSPPSLTHLISLRSADMDVYPAAGLPDSEAIEMSAGTSPDSAGLVWVTQMISSIMHAEEDAFKFANQICNPSRRHE